MRNPQRISNVSSFVRVLSCNLISERELSWCLVAVSVDFLVPLEISSWQIPTFALNKGAHLPLVPTRPHHVEVRRGFRDPSLYRIKEYTVFGESSKKYKCVNNR